MRPFRLLAEHIKRTPDSRSRLSLRGGVGVASARRHQALGTVLVTSRFQHTGPAPERPPHRLHAL
jgi:hypothetical protein